MSDFAERSRYAAAGEGFAPAVREEICSVSYLFLSSAIAAESGGPLRARISASSTK